MSKSEREKKNYNINMFACVSIGYLTLEFQMSVSVNDVIQY